MSLDTTFSNLMKMAESSPKGGGGGLEKTEGKGEIARYIKDKALVTSMFPQCFQKSFSSESLKPEIV